MCQTLAIAAVTVSLFAGSKSYTVSTTAGGTFCPETVTINIQFPGEPIEKNRLSSMPVIHTDYQFALKVQGKHKINMPAIVFSYPMLQTKEQDPLIDTFVCFFIILFVYL